MISNRKQNILQDLSLGILRGTNYHLHTSLCNGMKPSCLELMVNSRCNTRCIMCNIWKSKSNNDLSLTDIESILCSPLLSDLRWIDITGGEIFLRKDLIQIIEIINLRQKKLQEIVLATNGFMTDRIIDQTRQILENLGVNIRLRVGISFDGIGEEHDKVRGVKGIHAAAIKTVEGLKKIKDDRLFIQGHVAVGPYNIDNLEEIRNYCSDFLDKVNWFPVIVSDNYFNNQENATALKLNPRNLNKLKEHFNVLINEEPPSPSTYYYSKLLNFMESGERGFPCTGGYRYMQIDSEGNVHPCPFISRDYSFGNIREQSLDQIWLNGNSKLIRKKLKGSVICKKCSSHCDVFALVRDEFFNFFTFTIRNPKVMKKLLKRYLFNSTK